MVGRFLLLASGLSMLCGCDSEPRVFSELLVTNEHFIYPDAYPPQTETDFRFSVDTLARLVKYPYVLTAALRDPDVAGSKSVRNQEHPQDWLAEQLEVSIVSSNSNSAFIRIAISNDVPSRDASTIVNSVVAAFQQEVVDTMRQNKLSQHEALQAYIRTERAELSRQQQELRRRDKEVSAAEREQAAIKLMMEVGFDQELKKRLGQIEWEILVSEVELERLRKNGLDRSVETPDAEGLIVPAELSLTRNIALRDRVRKEIKARQLEVRDLGSLWVDRDNLAEEVATQKARVAQLVKLAHKREVELQYQESHPPIVVKREAAEGGSGWDSPQYPQRHQAGTGNALVAAPGTAAAGLSIGLIVGAGAAVMIGRMRRRRRQVAAPTNDPA